MSETILVVEDDRFQLQMMLNLLHKKLGYQVKAAANGKQAVVELNRHNHDTFSAILLDVNMPHMDGFEVLAFVRKRFAHVPVIMLTSDTNPQTAVKAIKSGAFDFINKPVDAPHLEITLKNAIQMQTMSDQLSRIKRNEEGELHFKDLVGYNTGLASCAMAGLKAAVTQAPVFITGETGTGKELFARAIHGESARAGKPFVAINCGAIPEKLIESILFGHEKGAFTGATEKTLGKFREAEGGTIFLDELGELPPAAQVKLLRVLQEQEIEPVGSAAPVKVDVRIISATHRRLEEHIKQGHFREDLFFRLNVLPIHIPPLRERGEDIITLAHYFLKQAAAQDVSPLKSIAEDARQYLLQREWSGNIRELSNLMRRASIWCDSDEITEAHLCALESESQHATTASAADQSISEIIPIGNNGQIISLQAMNGQFKTMEQLEKEIMQAVLTLEDDNIANAADKLGIAKSTFYRKVKQMRA